MSDWQCVAGAEEVDMKKGLTYKASGVDIDHGDAFIRKILPFTQATHTHFSMGAIGAFAGMVDITSGPWKKPILVACTDGVGTKLKIAIELNRHDSIGIDLVAMSVNDLLVTGAEPVAFLDYLATSRLDSDRHADVVRGISRGCVQGGCALIGGETAEMPGFYSPGDYDIAGFAVGIVDKDKILDPQNAGPGDIVLGLPSSGIHSNGYSLVRKVFEDRNHYSLNKTLPGFPHSLGEELLIPTRIYSAEFAILRQLEGVKSAAHITGGGIPGNLIRALPGNCGACLDRDSWPVQRIFQVMQKEGRITEKEMFRTFNMGLGMILVIDSSTLDDIRAALAGQGFESYRIGRVCDTPGIHWSNSHLTKKHRSDAGTPSRRHAVRKPRIAVFGSGRGSNMAAILRAIDRGDFDAEIVCVISNNSKAYILEHAEKRNIPVFHVSRKTHPGTEWERVSQILADSNADTLVLAGYMKKIPDDILAGYKERSFNIHPALLPAFGGKGMFGHHVHESVLKSGAKFSGVTVHRIDSEYDSGDILAQRVVPVLPSDTAETLAARVLVEEHDIYWRVLRKHLNIGND
jgi:formyltetrahydrofolate-dependent phosphoribosylglycinamide formyltransferase